MTSGFLLTLDPTSPVPLYHQIAEAIRYRIATGALREGIVLPPLREAARAWKVNLHTVRRAYAELADAGIVATRGPSGTQVLPQVRPAVSPREEARARFVRKMVDEARKSHGLDIPALIGLIERTILAGAGGIAAAANGTVYVSECSRSQSEDLARQIEARWRVKTVPWPVDGPEPPRPDPVVATYFHYNDVRQRWPSRLPDVRFLAIRPDPGLGRELLRVRRGNRRIRVLLCEREESMLRNIASDLSTILSPKRFLVTSRVMKDASSCLRGVGADTPVLVAPRIWGEMPDTARNDPRVREIRYLFEQDQLEALGRDLGWAPR